MLLFRGLRNIKLGVNTQPCPDYWNVVTGGNNQETPKDENEIFADAPGSVPSPALHSDSHSESVFASGAFDGLHHGTHPTGRSGWVAVSGSKRGALVHGAPSLRRVSRVMYAYLFLQSIFRTEKGWLNFFFNGPYNDRLYGPYAICHDTCSSFECFETTLFLKNGLRLWAVQKTGQI